MFSFFKNLFNFRKTDTNPVKKDQQVKFESHTRLENVKIKAKDFDKTSSNNQSYEKVQSKYFFSNEKASTSSETNAQSSFNSEFNTIYSRQRVCARLAAKKITKDVEELALQSDEGEGIMDESSDQESSKKPKLIKKTNRLCKKTIRLCPNCKTLKTMIGNATKGMNCNICGTILMYLCTKCENKHYISYRCYIIHENECNRKSITRKVKNSRNKSRFHNCPDCDNKIFNEKSLRFQLVKNNHNVIHDKKETQNSQNSRDNMEVEEETKKAHPKENIVKTKRPKTKHVWFSRYCQTCQKTVMGVSIEKYVKCQTCSKFLLFQCLKCYAKYTSYSGLYNHSTYLCFPNGQKISKVSSMKWRPTLGVQKTSLKCDMCIYQSKFKQNLIQHIKGVHMNQKEFCQKCPFETTYHRSLIRHDQRKHLLN